MSACTVCGGAWLYNLVFRHADGCSYRTPEDRTTAADSQRPGRTFIRPTTVAEWGLAHMFAPDLQSAVTEEDLAAHTTRVERVTATIRRRTITTPSGVVIDPDQIQKEEAS